MVCRGLFALWLSGSALRGTRGPLTRARCGTAQAENLTASLPFCDLNRTCTPMALTWRKTQESDASSAVPTAYPQVRS
jgi:hypothetical protein